ncbi:MAG: hypothetical protein ACPGVO_23145 [Spirulinaceae cyanobacterium]
MDALQQKIITLQERVDALYSLVEHTHQMVSTSFVQAETTDSPDQVDPAQPPSQRPLTPIAPHRAIALNSELTHKDVLPDDEQSSWEQFSDYHGQDQSLSPDLQIRRLTAQVTAAYNRIAALEEQLLARRNKDSSSDTDGIPGSSTWSRTRS